MNSVLIKKIIPRADLDIKRITENSNCPFKSIIPVKYFTLHRKSYESSPGIKHLYQKVSVFDNGRKIFFISLFINGHVLHNLRFFLQLFRLYLLNYLL